MTFTASRIDITPTEAALGAVITGFDVNSVEPEVILQLKQAWRVACGETKWFRMLIL
ncbi:hypothetical protein [Nostoc sp. CALU 546]|uniref:hypothetical protein n=1 Tax=Nostoc sp. CALU 546 TaxID=1867241 RepID=UPI003B67FFDD